MSEYSKEFMNWLNAGISPWHTVDMAAKQLSQAGFEPLELNKPFNIKRGGKYYVNCGSALTAFSIGRKNIFRIAAAHTDWPCMRIKPQPELTGRGGVRLNIEPYGGAIYNTWLDRPLGLAGTVMLTCGDAMHPAQRLISWDEPLMVIPNVAIHLNREINKGVPYKANTDMLPVCRTIQGAFEKDGYLIGKIAERLGVLTEDILSFELCAYCFEEASLVGFEHDLLSSPRIDNISSAHACIRALADADGDAINIAVLYDNEEIGSNTRRGADSAMLSIILDKLATALGIDRTDYIDACLNGMLLSCDVAHALHPNHPELADPVCAPVLGGGVALKRSPRYSTDAEGYAVITALCRENNIPLQTYMNRADIPGGSTVGSMASALLTMPAADVGAPILAMHSARELMGIADQDALIQLCTAFFNAKA